MLWDRLPKWIVKDPIRKEFVTTFKYRYAMIITQTPVPLSVVVVLGFGCTDHSVGSSRHQLNQY
jgi:hypothetical protein